MSCFSITVTEPSGKIIEVESTSGANIDSITLTNYSAPNIEISQCLTQLPSDFNDRIFAVVSGDIVASTGVSIASSGGKIYLNSILNSGTGIALSYNSGIYTISSTGLQPSGNYSLVGHQHIISDVSGLQIALDNKQPSGIYASGIHYHVVNDITNFNSGISGLLPSVDGDGYVISSFSNNTYTISVSGLQPSGNYSIVGHSHVISDVSGLQNALDSKQPSGVYASGIHSHVSNDITDFSSSVSGLLPSVTGIGQAVSSFGNNLYTISVTGLQPSGDYSVVGHTHLSSDITDFDSAVSGLIPPSNFTSLSGVSGVLVTNNGTDYLVSLTDPTIQLADITDLSANAQTFLLTPSSYNLSTLITNETGSGILVFNDSPTFSGIPTVPTAPSGTNTNQIASTSFVRNEISNLVDSAPNTLDTLNELAAALGDDPNFATTIANNLANKANLSGAIFTGPVTIPSGTGNFDSLTVNNIVVSISGHTHTASQITDFNEAVDDRIGSGLFVAGTGINLNYNDGSNSFTVGVTGLINNPTNNRILTSRDSTTTGIDAESNLTFDGSLLSVSGNLVVNSGTLNSITFNDIGDPNVSARQLAWNSSEGSLALALSNTYDMYLGGELHYRVRNETGAPIIAGTAVYASGVAGGSKRITVTPKAADGSIRETRFMGLVTENINNGVNGFTTHFGYIRNIDTRGDYAANGATNKVWASGEPVWAEGDILYIHPTAEGKLTKIEPKHSISVAIILNRHQSEGKLFVRPTSYGHLNDNHDVDVSGATNGQFLQYNSETDYWVPSSSGNFTTLLVNGIAASVSGHTHTASQITDFNSSVNALIPIQIHPFLLGGM